MYTALKTEVIVQPGSRIEFLAPELAEGEKVEILVLVPERSGKTASSRSALEIIQSLQGHRQFETPQQADAYLQEERAAWER